MRLSRHTVMDMLSETGVTTDDTTRQNAYIMVATSLLYLFPQVPAFLGEEHDPQAALMGCVACFVVLAAYCAFQVVAPELQKRKMKMAQKAYMRQKVQQRQQEAAKQQQQAPTVRPLHSCFRHT